MKVLITGSEGFVGKHLVREFISNGHEVIRCDIRGSEGFVPIDITNPEQVKSVLDGFRPDALINLAGQANVGLSWSKPQLTFSLNTIGLINVLEAVKAVNPGIRVITVGSSDEYGPLGTRGENVTEDYPLNPITPYAVSKVAQENLAKIYNSAFGMNICMVRMFNIGGAGQAKGFLISDFASGIAEIEVGRKEHLSVGNLESARDFTHIKDACRAYRLIAEKGHTGEVYNICSGITHTAKEVLDGLIRLSSTDIRIKTDPTRMRPSDTPVIRGNNDKLKAHTGWIPELDVGDILKDSLSYWRENIHRGIE